ncbi:MAG TPA: CRISPR-associated helicase Cas3' [Thermoanaerobaculia bacterium]|nr:CRISPR-associated helicase Cas3' [Thermoanaerobaculia bacterium]
MKDAPLYYRYWGKAQGDSSEAWHPLVYHMLDAGAVCDVFLEHDRTIVRSISRSSGLSESSVRSFLPFLVALHDLGKFAESFQDLKPEIVAQLHGSRAASPYTVRHDRMGYVFWSDVLSRRSWDESWPLATVEETRDWNFAVYRDAMDPWLRAATGHHGEPPGISAVKPASQSFSARACSDAIELVRELINLLRPDKLLLRDAYSAESALNPSAWSVAGLAVLCDWIGSNQKWFGYSGGTVPLQEYWSRSREKAEDAVKESGVLPNRASSNRGMAGLFPRISQPSPLQTWAETVPLGEGPHLAIGEEITGSGKTEAAIVLAQRLIHEGRADGMFIALPTMATATAMHARLRSMYERLFDEGETASIVLTHSARHLDDAASDYCTVWLADHRKKALLSQVGVGTIDQALLGVLPARHNVLRLLGLQRSVLIVDEVHAYDSYMSRILERLLEFHAALGGSAILLSATLPQSMRQRYVTAFSKGLGRKPDRVSQDAYPLFTQLGSGGLSETPLETRSGSRRSVKVEFLERIDAAVETIERAVREGRSACWVRNSVNDAIEAYETIAQRLGDDVVTLFHARFMMGDRKATEDDVMRRFGPESGRAKRAGHAVIATQVVEQSLDLDFDVMVSDLAPVDLLIQRAGRLQRHLRTEQGDRTTGADGRPTPVLQILAPAWSDEPDAGWVSTLLPRTAFVYGHLGQLWLSMRILRERGCITLPEDARLLIETVYGDDALDRMPESLRHASLRFEGEQSARASIAGFNSLVLHDGYKSTPAHWIADTVTPTRLSEPTTAVRLALRSHQHLAPLFEHAKHPWDMSQLSVRRSQLANRVSTSLQEERIVRGAEETMHDKGKWSLTLVMDALTPREWRGRALDESGNPVEVRYDKRRGLLMRKEAS